MPKGNKIYLGADHAGFEMKEHIKLFLEENGYDIEDLGANELNPTDDYPDYGIAVAKKVVSDNAYGILICGSGIGICTAANKVKGALAATCYSEYAAKMGRQDENTNICCLAGRVLTSEEAEQIVTLFLNTRFSGEERHVRRLDKIREFEK